MTCPFICFKCQANLQNNNFLVCYVNVVGCVYVCCCCFVVACLLLQFVTFEGCLHKNFFCWGEQNHSVLSFSSSNFPLCCGLYSLNLRETSVSAPSSSVSNGCSLLECLLAHIKIILQEPRQW